MNKRNLSLCLAVWLALLQETCQQEGRQESFKAELFLNSDDLNAGLYEGEVRGRKRFGETQVPHGVGTIYYFTTDKFNRVNYTGDWVNGQREGNGTTSFKDGAVYQGGYKQGLENGAGYIRYENGNTLDAEFVAGKIQGHGVFRYSGGDQREGFFKDNILDGQVIFTRSDGLTVIEQWVDGKQVQNSGGDVLQQHEQENLQNTVELETLPERNEIVQELPQQKPRPSSPQARGGLGKAPVWGGGEKGLIEPQARGRGPGIREQTRSEAAEAIRLAQQARSRARSFLFDIYSGVSSD